MSLREDTIEFLTVIENASNVTGNRDFVIAVPIFENGPAYTMIVRLRYRVQSGSIVWYYEMFKLRESMEDAFEEVLSEFKEKTGIPTFRV